jgi:hypothetical protein
MANQYTYRVEGIPPLEILKIVANSKAHAESKLRAVLVDGQNLKGWNFIHEEKIDNHEVV